MEEVNLLIKSKNYNVMPQSKLLMSLVSYKLTRFIVYLNQKLNYFQ